MEPKTIIAIVLVAFIIGGFIFLQVKHRKKKKTPLWGGGKNPAPISILEVRR